MTATRRGARARSHGDASPGAATARGALLIAAAVVVGVVLLGKGFDNGILPSRSETPSEEAGDDAAGDGGDDASTTTSTTATPTTHPPAEVRVQVLNSTGPSGSAGAATDAFAAAGYTTVPAANAEDQSATASVVYAAPEYEADARALAEQLGIAAEPQPMPTPPPPPAPADANVVVVLGPDAPAPG